MTDYLSTKELEALRRWPTCAISNAIELFNIRPRNMGFMLPEIKCIFPEMGAMIGYAVTAVITANSPEGRRISPPDRKVLEAAQRMEAWERPIIDFCKSSEFSAEGLKRLYTSPRPTM